MKKCFLLTAFAFTLFACDNLVKKKEVKSETATNKKKKKIAETDEEETQKPEKNVVEEEIETNSDAEILNKIIVHESGGMKVSRAFLSHEDGRLLTKANKAALGEAVYLNLLIDKGWKIEDGTVSLDATEKIFTDKGETVLNAPNLFKTMPLVDESKAANIYLKATITKTRPDIDYFLVTYRVWDKRGEGEVKGSYKLYVEETEE